MGRYLPWLVPILASAALHAGAAGSFTPEIELKPILEEVPEIRRLVEESFELAPSGSARRIGLSVNPRFGGRRMGPYHITARAKGTAGPDVFELIFHTEVIALGPDGENVKIPDAHEIHERLRSLEVRLITSIEPGEGEPQRD